MSSKILSVTSTLSLGEHQSPTGRTKDTNFMYRSVPEVMISAIGDEVIALCITFLTNSEYIKNPYLKAKLVSLLFHGTWPVYHRTKGVLGDALTGTKFANDHLLHALMKFYIGKLFV
jgi:ubiquitin conjugation factor E4 B